MKKINLKNYNTNATKHKYVDKLSELTKKDTKEFLSVGIDTSNKKSAATFLQKDSSILHCSQKDKGLEILNILDAEKKYKWLKDYSWKLIKPEKDEITKLVNKKTSAGYFIRSLKKKHIKEPVQACLHINKKDFVQNVHNIIIAEENSTMNVVAGCSSSHNASSSLHLGVSEFYIKKGATLTYTMVHDWGKNVSVRPKTVINVEEGGTYISNYISLKPVGSLIMNPVTYLNGKGAIARINSIIVADENTHIDAGGDVILNAEETKSEIISRAISIGGTIITRGKLSGRASKIKAHLECKGLIMRNGILHAIPELDARVPNVEMSHEAAVGKIDKREIEYLMARGLDEDAAISTIVRGFLNVNIVGLSEGLKKQVDDLINKTQADVF